MQLTDNGTSLRLVDIKKSSFFFFRCPCLASAIEIREETGFLSTQKQGCCPVSDKDSGPVYPQFFYGLFFLPVLLSFSDILYFIGCFVLYFSARPSLKALPTFSPSFR